MAGASRCYGLRAFPEPPRASAALLDPSRAAGRCGEDPETEMGRKRTPPSRSRWGHRAEKPAAGESRPCERKTRSGCDILQQGGHRPASRGQEASLDGRTELRSRGKWVPRAPGPSTAIRQRLQSCRSRSHYFTRCVSIARKVPPFSFFAVKLRPSLTRLGRRLRRLLPSCSCHL